MFTYAERAFLLSQKIGEHQVFDGRKMRKSEREVAAKQVGHFIILTDGSCTKGLGHRLATSSGHCIQCKTERIEFSGREHMTGYVYIAASIKAQLLKIGCSKDVDGRELTLNAQRYGEQDDWVVVAHTKTPKMQAVENEIHSGLKEFSVTGRYYKEGRWQETRELFRGPLQKVWIVYKAKTCLLPASDKWQARDIQKFAFIAAN
jgi:hypothetical protein